MDSIRKLSVHGPLRLSLFNTLLLPQDKDDRLLSDIFLLWIHSYVLSRAGHHVRGHWISGIVHVCAAYLPEHQV